METETTEINLLAGMPVGVMDAERLVLEGIERLGERAAGLGRLPMLALLRRVIEEGVRVVERSEHTCTLAEAGWASIAAREGCRSTTMRDLRYHLRRMLKQEGAAELRLRAMSTAQCRELLQKTYGESKSSFIKGRAVLHSIFAYGIRQEWCDVNPVARIEVPKVQEKMKEPLSLAEVEQLLRTAEQPEHRAMRFSLHLMLYSGIRPAEVSRLQARDFCWAERMVVIRPRASKTGGGRMVPLRKLSDIRAEERCIPRNWPQRWQALRRAAGFRHWVPDICRHSFASYHAAHFRNLPELQMEMGHRDLSLLRSRYMLPVHKNEAARFWHMRQHV